MVATTSHIFSGKVDTENNNESDPDASLHVTYATTSALNTGLSTKQDSGSYATTSALSTGLATKQDSGSYATTSALATGLSTKQDSGSYATTSALNTGLSTKQDSGSYATTSALSTGLGTKQDSGSYATTSALTTGLQTTRTQLEVQLQAEKIENEITRLKLANAESRISILEQSFGSILSKLNV